MLELLRIHNYALIEKLEVEFASGFNALTGETGAGKSIVIGALNLVLGARATGSVIRKGANKAHIEALFRLETISPRLDALLQLHEISLEDDCLLLARTITQEGRSRGFAGGKLVPINVLSAMGDELVDLHGQHEHQSLLKTERQLDLLDGFADLEVLALTLEDKVENFRKIERKLRSIEQDDRDKTRQMEFLRFELDEINTAALEPDEDTRLKERINVINNAEKIFTLANHVYTLLYGSEDSAALDNINIASREMEELAELTPELGYLSSQLTDVRESLESVTAELRRHTDMVEFDEEELEQLNLRLALIGSLKRKYGTNIIDILAYRDRATAELNEYEQRDTLLESLRAEHEQVQKEALECAKSISKKRNAAAKQLDRLVKTVLQDLGMKGAHFETQFETGNLTVRGIDKIAFMLAANKGESLLPLKQVASGGEVSRIMLALKTAFSQADTIPTLIFDEIDSGVGGAIARKVADKLDELARSHQIICITHIPQIAALAKAHYRVEKQSIGNRTTTQVVAVEATSRVEEIARLLDGTLSEVSLEHARVLLDMPGGKKKSVL